MSDLKPCVLCGDKGDLRYGNYLNNEDMRKLNELHYNITGRHIGDLGLDSMFFNTIKYWAGGDSE